MGTMNAMINQVILKSNPNPNTLATQDITLVPNQTIRMVTRGTIHLI